MDSLGPVRREWRLFPGNCRPARKAGVLVTALGTNAPAYRAGLRAGDLILELAGQPVTTLQAFRRAVDQAPPGTKLAVTAYRGGQTAQYEVATGKETFRLGGLFLIAFPPIVRGWNLFPNHNHPGFSVAVAGCDVNPGERTEIGSVNRAVRARVRPQPPVE